ncbi:DMT family transporter [Marinomonas balearica]|uniref:EamA-like transporter family protein n=1 Tax=Marinomonas balearica TaxID=491947 RepID=A0A4V3CGJ1_9GAMM|nr:EamA family transporter [Marinomonas balearica]TDO97952.1 EamA-like transporter family protein [Marinomonas balearica]
MISFKNPSTHFASLVAFFAAAFWGVYWIPLRYLESQGVQGVTAVVLLSLPAILPLLIMVGMTRHRYQTHWRALCLIGLCTGLGIALYSSGVIYSSVVRATLLFYLTPVWSTLIEIFWLRERVTWTRWLAVVVGLLGMVLLLSGGDWGEQGKGDILAFLSGIFWAFGASMVRRYNRIPIPGMALGQFSFTVIGALLIGYFLGSTPMDDVDLTHSAGLVMFSFSLLILMPIVAAIFWAQKVINPGRAGLLMMSEVMVAVISASIILPEERMHTIEWFGAVLILSACLVEVLGSMQLKTDSKQFT